MHSDSKACASAEKRRWLHGFGNWLDIDREEARKRRLYVLLSVPGMLFLLVWGIYNTISDNLIGGLMDIFAAIMLFMSVPIW